ncbi:MAG: signal peptidase I [Oscillospiraceae bacterium]|nr:signal peptidase I [Oscillospiraceae bacterium]
MADNRSSSSRRPIKKGGKFFPALCNVIGTLILLAVILTSIPLAIPRLLGYETYNVTSGSMEPALPVGSVIYVEAVEPDKVQVGDIIAYYVDSTVVTHRVVENRIIGGEYITKGDANEMEDFSSVQYRDLVGRVRYHVPLLGGYLMIFSSQVTKIYLLVLAFCGVMFNMLAGRMRRRQNEKFREQLERWERHQAAKRKAELEEIRK